MAFKVAQYAVIMTVPRNGAVITCVSKSNWFCMTSYTIGLKNSRQFFIQSEINGDSLAYVFPRFTSAASKFFGF